MTSLIDIFPESIFSNLANKEAKFAFSIQDVSGLPYLLKTAISPSKKCECSMFPSVPENKVIYSRLNFQLNETREKCGLLIGPLNMTIELKLLDAGPAVLILFISGNSGIFCGACSVYISPKLLNTQERIRFIDEFALTCKNVRSGEFLRIEGSIAWRITLDRSILQRITSSSPWEGENGYSESQSYSRRIEFWNIFYDNCERIANKLNITQENEENNRFELDELSILVSKSKQNKNNIDLEKYRKLRNDKWQELELSLTNRNSLLLEHEKWRNSEHCLSIASELVGPLSISIICPNCDKSLIISS